MNVSSKHSARLSVSQSKSKDILVILKELYLNPDRSCSLLQTALCIPVKCNFSPQSILLQREDLVSLIGSVHDTLPNLGEEHNRLSILFLMDRLKSPENSALLVMKTLCFARKYRQMKATRCINFVSTKISSN